MSCGSLRDLVVGAWLHSVDKVWKEDSILDEEDRNVVSHDICHQTVVRQDITFSRSCRMTYRSYLGPCRIWSQTHEHPGPYLHCLCYQQLLRIGQIPESASLLQKGTKQL